VLLLQVYSFELFVQVVASVYVCAADLIYIGTAHARLQPDYISNTFYILEGTDPFTGVPKFSQVQLFLATALFLDVLVHGFLSYYARMHWHEPISQTVKRIFHTDGALVNFVNIAQIQVLATFFMTIRIYYMVNKSNQTDSCVLINEQSLKAVGWLITDHEGH
jgi:hypothetical protein